MKKRPIAWIRFFPSARFIKFCPLLLVFLFVSCKNEIVREAFIPRNEYEAYRHSLELAKLDQTALGRDWNEAGGRSLKEPIDISLPYEEQFYLDPKIAEAVGYRFTVKRGLRIEVSFSVRSADSLLLFCDLFRVSDPDGELTHVATATRESHRLEFEPRQDANYVLRIQPELLRGGSVRVLIREVPSIGFPVEGKNSRSIQSFFGDARDAGSRDHHGVDIFAARHTPVLAPSRSTVTRVGEGEIGGRHIWLYDSVRSISMYFAHLETQAVSPGTRVVAGQAIGTVGNSGNARSTPPHLHFGIYSRGPVDPYHFIAETDTVPAVISGDSLLLGEQVRTKQVAFLRSTLLASSQPVDTFQKHSVMKVAALAGKYYRIVSPDGISGYIPQNQVEAIHDAIRQEIMPDASALLESPQKNSVPMTNIQPGDKIALLGLCKDFAFVMTPEGKYGWLQIL